VAVVVGLVLGAALITAGISLAIWRGLLSTSGPGSAAPKAVISPSSRTVQVACRPPWSSADGRPTTYRADLLTSLAPRRVWDWKLCGTTASPVSYQSWNARQWYSPDPCLGLTLPEPSKSFWKPCSFSSPVTTVSSSQQNWYSPGYHYQSGGSGGGFTSPSSSLRRQQHYYSTRVTDPREYRTIPSFYVA